MCVYVCRIFISVIVRQKFDYVGHMTRVNIYELLPVSYVGLPMRQALRHINTRE